MTECGRSLQLHRVIAVNVSKKLSAELAAKPTATELHVRNVKYSALEKLLDFIYSGKVLLSNPNDLQDFADAHNVLRVDLGVKVDKMIARSPIGSLPTKPIKLTKKGQNGKKGSYQPPILRPQPSINPTMSDDPSKITQE